MENTKTEIRKTITSIFMVPSLHIPKDALKNNGFLNGYSRDVIRDVHYENAIYLLFRPEQIDKFREFLDSEYERTKHLIEDYDHNGGFVVVVYKLDMKFANDFTLIKQGKYSHTSPAFQAEFSKVTKIVINGLSRDEISLQYRVFNKTKDLIEFWEKKFDVTFDATQELWNGYNEENETLTEEKLREYEQQ